MISLGFGKKQWDWLKERGDTEGKSRTIFWTDEWERRTQTPLVVLPWQVCEGEHHSLEDAMGAGKARSQVR